MPLRADDVQSAEADDFVVIEEPLLAGLLLDLFLFVLVGHLTRLLRGDELGVAA